MIITYPKGIRGGSAARGLYSHYDLLPTIAELVGETPDSDCPGHSFAEIFRGQVPDGGKAVVVYDEYGPARMIRTEEYKYIRRYLGGEDEFYDLKADPDEEVNLAASKEPEVQERITVLREQLGQWFARYSDPERDGTGQAVYGHGQIALVGKDGKGQEAFIQ